MPMQADSYFQDMNFLCELYQNDLILVTDGLRNPNPMVGDLKLRAFVSYIHYQTQWVLERSKYFVGGFTNVFVGA